MNKLLFNIPRPTVPVFVRNAPRAGVDTAALSFGGNSCEDDGGKSLIEVNQTGSASWVKSDLEFPVRRIYCVGRNYREHAIEMGGDPDRELPFFFQKPPDSIVVCSPQHPSSTPSIPSVPYPPKTASLHYEGEIIVAISKDGFQIPVQNAMDYIYGYSIGCDLTRRDLQSDAKKKGRPWDAAKGFDFSCPLSPIVPKEEVFKSFPIFDDDNENANANDDTTTNHEEILKTMQLTLKVNGSIRQQSSVGCMIYSVPEIISHLSELFRLQAGDLILTGTPAGVSDINVGDRVSISCRVDLDASDGDLLIPCEFVIGPKC